MQYSKYVYSFAIDSNNVALYHSLLIRTIFLTKAEIDQVKDEFDYIFIDCPPSFGMLTVNAMAAADYVLITCQTEFLSSRAMGQLLRTIIKIKKISQTPTKYPRPSAKMAKFPLE